MTHIAWEHECFWCALRSENKAAPHPGPLPLEGKNEKHCLPGNILATLRALKMCRSFGRILEWLTNYVVRELIGSGLAPSEQFGVPVCVAVVSGLTVAVVAEPALVSIFPAAPTNQGRFADPGVVVIL